MNLLYTIRRSIFSREFYAQVPGTGLKSGFKYLLALFLAVALLAVIRMIPVIFTLLSQETADSIVSSYPPGLVVTLAAGQVSVNQPEPIYIGKGVGSMEQKHMLVIDTASPFTGSQFDDYSTVALIKKDFAVVRDGEGSKIRRFASSDNFTLTQEKLEGWARTASPYLQPLAFAAVVLLFLSILFFGSAYTALYLLLPAGILFLVRQIIKKPMPYKSLYKVTLYAATFPIIVSSVVGFFGGAMPFLAFTMLLLLVAIVNLSEGPEEPPPAAPEPLQQ